MKSFQSNVSDLHGKLFHNHRISLLAERIAALLPEGVGLDVGTGDGKIPSLLMQKKGDVKIFGLEVPYRNYKPDHVVLYNGFDIPFKTKSVDFVLLIDVLHHTTDPFKLLKECSRVSKQKIIIKDHLCENTFDYLRLKSMDWVGNTSKGISLPYHYLSLKEWEALFDKLNFRKYSHQFFNIYKGIAGRFTGGHLQTIFDCRV